MPANTAPKSELRQPLEEISDDSFVEKVLYARDPGMVCVFFWSRSCGLCSEARQSYEILAKRYAGQITVYGLNTDLGHRYAKIYGVLGHPYSVFFRDGAEVDYHQGYAHEFVRFDATFRRALGLDYDKTLLFHDPK